MNRVTRVPEATLGWRGEPPRDDERNPSSTADQRRDSQRVAARAIRVHDRGVPSGYESTKAAQGQRVEYGAHRAAHRRDSCALALLE